MEILSCKICNGDHLSACTEQASLHGGGIMELVYNLE